MFFHLINFVCMKCSPVVEGGGILHHVITTSVASHMCIPAPQKWTLHVFSGHRLSSCNRPYAIDFIARYLPASNCILNRARFMS